MYPYWIGSSDNEAGFTLKRNANGSGICSDQENNADDMSEFFTHSSGNK